MDMVRLEILKIALDQTKALAQFALAAYECEDIPTESIRDHMRKSGEVLIEGSKREKSSFDF